MILGLLFTDPALGDNAICPQSALHITLVLLTFLKRSDLLAYHITSLMVPRNINTDKLFSRTLECIRNNLQKIDLISVYRSIQKSINKIQKVEEAQSMDFGVKQALRSLPLLSYLTWLLAASGGGTITPCGSRALRQWSRHWPACDEVPRPEGTWLK